MVSDSRRILITGARGFIGSHASTYFQTRGWEVLGIDVPGGVTTSPFQYMLLPDAAFPEMVRQFKPSAVLHAAGSASVPFSVKNPQADRVANVDLTKYVIDTTIKQAPSAKFVLLSSAAVYGNPNKLPIPEQAPVNPISPYGLHKHLAECLVMEAARTNRLQAASVRIFSAYGEGLRRQVLWDFTRKVLGGESPVLMGSGRESRDFIHVEDVVAGIECVLRQAAMQGETYNLASGTETAIADLARSILSNIRPDLVSALRFSGTDMPGMPQNWCAEIERLRSLGFRPGISITEGVRRYVEWAKSA